MPGKEKLVVKLQLKYMRLSPSDEGLISSVWTDCMFYLTTENIWYVDKEGKNQIPLDSIGKINDKPATKTSYVLILHIGEGQVREVLYFAGARSVIASIKHKINVLTNRAVKVEKEPNEVEKKLLMLLYMGITDHQSMSFFLGVSKDRIGPFFETLKSRGFLDGVGALTLDGMDYARKIKSEGYNM